MDSSDYSSYGVDVPPSNFAGEGISVGCHWRSSSTVAVIILLRIFNI